MTGTYARLSGMALFGSSDDDQQQRIEDLERRVLELERAAFNAGVPVNRPRVGEPNETWASEMVRRLAMDGQKIAAIKLFRDETGLGLQVCKDIVERLGTS